MEIQKKPLLEEKLVKYLISKKWFLNEKGEYQFTFSNKYVKVFNERENVNLPVIKTFHLFLKIESKKNNVVNEILFTIKEDKIEKYLVKRKITEFFYDEVKSFDYLTKIIRTNFESLIKGCICQKCREGILFEKVSFEGLYGNVYLACSNETLPLPNGLLRCKNNVLIERLKSVHFKYKLDLW